MNQEFYSIKEVAAVFAVHQITIRRALYKGLIPYIRIGKGKRSPYRISKKFIDSIHEESLKPFLKNILI